MAILDIRLQNFRSYKDSSYQFVDGVNVVVGPNASGKTNLLEAILVLAEGSSYRAKDPYLIKNKSTWARLDGRFDQGQRILKVRSSDDETEKTLELDGKTIRRVSYDKTIPVVLFEPNHLQLFTHGPQQRRDYIDYLLQKHQPQLKLLINKYRRVLAQRNTLLKEPLARTKDQMFVWDLRLSEMGSQIAQARQKLVGQINQSLSRKYSAIAKTKANAEVDYLNQFPLNNYATKMLSRLQADLALDSTRGFTAHGPHREDFTFKLNGRQLNLAASRGETRSLLLALKLLELELVESARAEKPILLLDDVFSELDGQRRLALVAAMKKYQTIITATGLDNMPKNMVKLAIVRL